MYLFTLPFLLFAFCFLLCFTLLCYQVSRLAVLHMFQAASSLTVVVAFIYLSPCLFTFVYVT